VAFLTLSLVLVGCADDPILGPEGPSDDGGGSYGVIKQFAPEDTADTAANVAPNPERF
jgi:hypothetical protein